MRRTTHFGLILSCFAAIAIAAPGAPKAADQGAVKAVASGSWHVYRGGPNMHGIAQGKLTDKPVLLWKYKTDRAIKSSPIVDKGVVFIGSNDGFVHAVKLKTGKPVWKFRVEAPKVSNEKNVVRDGDGKDAGGGNDGKGPNSKDAKKRDVSKPNSKGDGAKPKSDPEKKKPAPKEEDEPPAHFVPEAIEAPPLYLDGHVIFGASNGFLYSVDAKTGKEVWKYETEAEILGSANWVLGPDKKSKRILIGSYDNFLHCVDAKTGKMIWKYETDNYINGAPAIDRGGVVFGGCDGFVHVVSVDKGEKVASIEVEGYIAGTVALDEGRAYTGNMGNTFVCVDLTAKEMVWDYKDRNFPFFSAAALTDKHAIFGGRDRRLHCVNRDTGASIWQFKTRGQVDSSPVVCDDKVVVGSEDGRVYMVSLEKGEKIWDYEIGKPVMSSPAIVDGIIVIASEDGFVYAFGEKK